MKNILLIDDDPDDAMFFSDALAELNLSTSFRYIGSGTETMPELLKADGYVPDVIFLDIRMPTMDGFEFLELYDKLAIDKSNTRVYLLSSSLDPADIKKSSNNKYITQFLHKPLTQKILEEISL